ncbi:GNAT family N-acetyltransferase [Flagellimonas meridianipacifica]|uniref:Ribosomal protein S18 acetylase RimI-like enzyme n=1 Tax=Flagellimonas meridianipacifica TaxID=1080225 RepID=A0A2T0M6E2_9FLAO|nr:GNAT family N-acetyltransferase [Allomuricauda pacifica]PRX53054.1 ribosomal protein S18 acetylase RimI-like enzyme [Allomuricauda pacifica]
MRKFNGTIRDATLEDLPTLLEFEQGIITAERPFDSTLGKDPLSYYDLKEMVLDDNTCVIVAEVDGILVGSGYGISKKARHYLDHDNYAYLGFMFTHPEYRGMGINALIVDELVSWSKSQGFIEIRLTVYEDNIPAIKAYEKVGFKKHLVEMRMPRPSENQ